MNFLSTQHAAWVQRRMAIRFLRTRLRVVSVSMCLAPVLNALRVIAVSVFIFLVQKTKTILLRALTCHGFMNSPLISLGGLHPDLLLKI